MQLLCSGVRCNCASGGATVQREVDGRRRRKNFAAPQTQLIRLGQRGPLAFPRGPNSFCTPLLLHTSREQNAQNQQNVARFCSFSAPSDRKSIVTTTHPLQPHFPALPTSLNVCRSGCCRWHTDTASEACRARLRGIGRWRAKRSTRKKGERQRQA